MYRKVIERILHMKISVFYEHILEAANQSSMSVLDVCRAVNSYGITGVEIEDKRLLEHDGEAAGILKQADLEISCIYGFFDFAHKDDVKDGYKIVDLAKRNGAKKVMPIPGFVKGYQCAAGIEVERMVSALTAICGYAKENGIMAVLEDFDDKTAPYCNISGLKYFMDHAEGLRCAFDTGNFLYSEEDSFEALPEFIDKISHVHCKDRTWKEKEGEVPKETIKGRKMYSCAVGSGCIKMDEIVKEIIISGYDDYFAIEHFGSLCQLRDMEESAKWLQSF